MLKQRDKIFNAVLETTNSVNVNSGKLIDNFYTELSNYEDQYKKRYEKITDALSNIKYHSSKIDLILNKYQAAKYGGSSTNDIQKLIDLIEECIEKCEKLDEYENSSEILEEINSKTSNLKNLLGKQNSEADNKTDFLLKENDVTEDNHEFFKNEDKILKNLEEKVKKFKDELENIFKIIKNVEKPIIDFILKNKLSRDFQENIKIGIKDYNQLKETIAKKVQTNFQNYETNIKNGLSFAFTKKEANEKKGVNVDNKILNYYFKKFTNIYFRYEGDSRGNIFVSGLSEKFPCDIKENQKPKIFDIIVDNSIIELKFNVYYDNLRGTQDFLDKKQGSLQSLILSKDSIDQIESEPKLKNLLREDVKAKIIAELKSKGMLDDISTRTVKDGSQIRVTDEKKERNSLLTDKEEVKSWGNSVSDVSDDVPPLTRDFFRVGGNPEKRTKFKDTLINVKTRLMDNLEKEYKSDKKLETQQVNTNKTSTVVSNNNELETNTNSIITSIIENYEKERSSVNTIEEKIKLDTKFVDILNNLGLNLIEIFKINFEDKLAFIFFILIIHIIVYSLIESLIINEYLNDLIYVIAVYVGIYFGLMLLVILILNNLMSYRFRSMLNYLNIEYNINLITMHLFIVFMFYLIVLILSNYIEVLKVNEEEDRLQILYRIEVISSIIFIFSSIFVMLL